MPKTYRLERSQLVERSLEETFGFFADAANLQALTPEFLHFQITTPLPIQMRAGTLIDYRLRLFGLPIEWRTRIEEFVPRSGFVDSQVHGPYRLWRHRHEFHQTDEGVLVVDKVDYQLPLGLAGSVAQAVFVGATLRKIFAYRQQQIRQLLR
jgi:ligand-binding SRPBCC domain-containing protein